MKNINEDDICYVENFVRTELTLRLSEKCTRLGINMDDTDKFNFFGSFVTNVAKFEFSEQDRNIIFALAEQLKSLKFDQNHKSINERMKISNFWFCDQFDKAEPKKLIAPLESKNLLTKMLETAEMNATRPKQGYRYDDDYKRFVVYQRILSGRKGFQSLQLNAKGCLPSISTTNRYIHRLEHAVIEGELRSNGLVNYLNERNQKLFVVISEDATRVENRIQFDSRLNQLIGLVLPTNELSGMPVPFAYQAGTANEILQHLSNGGQTASFVNTIMAQPIGNTNNAAPFCLSVFGTDGRYTSENVSRRWKYASEELSQKDVCVLVVSSDSDPRYNAAMRMNSGLGIKSKFSMDGFFKGGNCEPPFYCQDFPHIGTKLRNFLLKTIGNIKKIPVGDYFVKMEHLQKLMVACGKDKHLLNFTDLNPEDRQNFDSVLKICDKRIIDLLTQNIKGSNGTVMFLKIVADVIAAYMDRDLHPIERVEKMWRSVFLLRIWRHFILKRPGLTLKDNFMSANCYYCIELNAHSIVHILNYLKLHNLTHLFTPHLFCSQPCENFYRQLRSLSTISSTVVNFTTKEILNRISRIQLLGEISNDVGSGFVFAKSPHSSSAPGKVHTYAEFPTEDEIMNKIQQCKLMAIEEAKKIGLIKTKNVEEIDLTCPISAYIPPKPRKTEPDVETEYDLEENLLKMYELQMKLMSVSLKNYADKFRNENVPENSSFVEIFGANQRIIFKKTSLCWFFDKGRQKCSSDRRYRVMTRSNTHNKSHVKNVNTRLKKKKLVKVKTKKLYRTSIQKKRKFETK